MVINISMYYVVGLLAYLTVAHSCFVALKHIKSKIVKVMLALTWPIGFLMKIGTWTGEC